MCFLLLKKVFPKSAKKLETLQKIVRVLALIEGILGLTILIVQLTVRALKFDKALKSRSIGNHSIETVGHDDSDTDEHQERAELTKLVVLGFFGLQAIFALILFEGARRKIMCMIKAWLIFCFFKLLIPLTIILFALYRQNKKFSPMWWTLTIEIASATFHIMESIFVLAFHHQAS